MTARLLGEAEGLGQAQPRALAFGFGGEERLEHPAHHFGAHARAGISDRQHHILARRHFTMGGRIGIIQMRVRHFQGQLAAFGHGVARIDAQVQDGVFHLIGIHQRVPQPARDHGFHFDLFAKRAAQKIGHVADHPAHVHRLGLQRLAAGKGQQLCGQARAPDHGADGVLQPVAQARIGLHHRARHRKVEIGADDLQQVVEVVRHPAGQVADGFHLLGLAHHAFGAQAGGDVHHTDQEAAGGDGRLVDIQFAIGPGDMLGVGTFLAEVGRGEDAIGKGTDGLHGLQVLQPRRLDARQVARQVQQFEEAAIVGAEQPVRGEIGDALAHRVQGRLQDGGFIGAGLFGCCQADIVAHQQGGGEQQDSQHQHACPDGEGDFQILDITAVTITLRQQAQLFLDAGRNLPPQVAHLLATQRQGIGEIGGRGAWRLLQLDIDRQCIEAKLGKPLQPVGALLLGRVVPGQLAKGIQVRRHPGGSGLVGLEIAWIAVNQIAALGGFRALHVLHQLPGDFQNLIGVAHPALRLTLVERELEGQIGDYRQHEKQRHCGEQHQTIGRQNSP